MHASRWIIVGGIAVAGVSLFLPFLDVPFLGTVNGIAGDGWPALVPLGTLGVIALLGDRAEGFDRPVALVAMLLGGLALIFSVEKVVDASLAARDAVELTGEGSVGAGVWLLVSGAAIALIGSVAGLSRRL